MGVYALWAKSAIGVYARVAFKQSLLQARSGFARGDQEAAIGDERAQLAHALFYIGILAVKGCLHLLLRRADDFVAP